MNYFGFYLKPAQFILCEKPPAFPVSIFGILYDALPDPAEQNTLNYASHLANLSSSIIDLARKHKFTMVHYSLEWGNEEFIIQNLEKLKDAFSEAQKKAKKYGKYCDDPFRSYSCLMRNSIVCLIDINGDFYPCCYALNQDYKVGNIFADSFDTLWQETTYKDFKKGKLCDSCYILRMSDIDAGRITLDSYKENQA